MISSDSGLQTQQSEAERDACQHWPAQRAARVPRGFTDLPGAHCQPAAQVDQEYADGQHDQQQHRTGRATRASAAGNAGKGRRHARARRREARNLRRTGRLRHKDAIAPSSQKLEARPKNLRITALPALTTMELRISHDVARPINAIERVDSARKPSSLSMSCPLFGRRRC